MIEFRLDGRSKVATYMQLVQQVKQAVRLGRLDPGDQLPTVRDVAESLAINPNTVLKAYRELEHEGLIEVRVGLGTFLRRSGAGRALRQQDALERELIAWLRKTGAAGWEREDVVALFETALRTHYREGAA